MHDLAQRGLVTTFDQWDGGPLRTDRPPLREADRVAALLVSKLTGLDGGRRLAS